jgi:hypothetical protein
MICSGDDSEPSPHPHHSLADALYGTGFTGVLQRLVKTRGC